MADNIPIRLVTVEFLRPGPAHNQVLSPFTQYLTVCGAEPAGVVTIPYEQARFERRFEALRADEGYNPDRQALLHEVGEDIGKVLGGIPGLSRALHISPTESEILIHLRLTMSASELALLPFELAKVPVLPAYSGEGWLVTQTRPPVCVTRNIRTVSSEGVVWPSKPRVLFIAGPGDIPFTQHREQLLKAIEPFRYPPPVGENEEEVDTTSAEQRFGDMLTILLNPTLSEVLQECRRTAYTHVHILTHGALDEVSGLYGVTLRTEDEEEDDIVTGERFADTINSVRSTGIHRPTVVTVASCDSGNQGDVIRPGGSFAHALHQSGIPLVIASQFPLTFDGSVIMASLLYEGLLWGEHPLVLLQQLRAQLHASESPKSHDWISLVAYEALPANLYDQLETLKYYQARKHLDAILQRIDREVKEDQSSEMLVRLGAAVSAVDPALERLPTRGQYAVECLGLRASSRKRQAQACYTFGDADATLWGPEDQYDLLETAWRDYDTAVRTLLLNEARVIQRKATLHWVLVQSLSLSAILGKKSAEGSWEVAHLAAQLYQNHPNTDERVWAHASLAELWLLRLADPDLTEKQKEQYSTQVLEHGREIVRIYGGPDEFPVTSTARQFARYVDWWGTSQFLDGLQKRTLESRHPWDGQFGLLETASRFVDLLTRKGRQPRGGASGSGGKKTSSPRSANERQPAAAAPVVSARRTGRTDGAALSRTAALSTPPSTRQRSGSFFDIEMLPADYGDCLWIEYGRNGSTSRVLVDCGTRRTARELLQRVDAVPDAQRRLELFVMTHIDADHIGGAIPFFKAVKAGLRIGDVWFNGWQHLRPELGARQGEMFSSAIRDFNLPWNAWRERGAIVTQPDSLPTHTLPGGMTLTLLSPGHAQLKRLAKAWKQELARSGLLPGRRVDYTKYLKRTQTKLRNLDDLAGAKFDPDLAAANGSSIALLAEFEGASVLLAADAHAAVLVESIRALLRQRGQSRLKVDAFKVSHHASQRNVSQELIELLDCRRYLVSTSGNHFFHPDPQAMARIILKGGERPQLYFNYRSEYNKTWEGPDLQEKYRYSTIYPPAGESGMAVSLLPSGQ